MSTKRPIKVILTIIGCLVLCIASFYVISGISLFSLGNLKFLFVQPDFAWEYQRGIHFSIFEGMRQVNDGCLIDVDLPGDPHDYEIMLSADRAYLALVDPPLYAFKPLVLCNLETNLCWPCDFDGREKDRIRDEIFEHLSSEYPQLERSDYWESHDVP